MTLIIQNSKRNRASRKNKNSADWRFFYEKINFIVINIIVLFFKQLLGAFTGGDNSPGVSDKEYVTCNTCKAPTTAYQGIIEDENGYNVCQKCNPETELFIDGTGCIKKSEMVSYDKKSMRDCWMAEISAQYNCCMQLGKTYLDEYKKKTNKDINKSNHFNCCLLNGNWNGNSCTDGDGNTINFSEV